MAKTPESFDWQGHRGCRGILPENSIPGFLKALEFPIKTLELDIVMSGDTQLVISHEPWFSYHICNLPDGTPVTKENEMKLQIYHMTYDQVNQFDCGSRGNPRFPDQLGISTHKPRLLDMIGTVETYCEDRGRTKPNYNIEIKSMPQGYDTLFPRPEFFVERVLADLNKVNIAGRVTIQSFDTNVLEELHRQKSPHKTAYLVESQDSLSGNLEKLSFKPDIYSPYFKLLDKEIVQEIHGQDMLVIPWTVNTAEEMISLIAMGVDGIITDFPNLIDQLEQRRP
ncbi:MAG: glycerophosphodiester phosphodiesterase [Bacteroidia bacterium]|nr:glycerophosphodiester phosphodiesterase [Bacteroidia bacterium]